MTQHFDGLDPAFLTHGAFDTLVDPTYAGRHRLSINWAWRVDGSGTFRVNLKGGAFQ